MNQIIALALLAALKQEVVLLEKELTAQQELIAVVSTSTFSGGPTEYLSTAAPVETSTAIAYPTLSFDGINYPDTQANMDLINEIQQEQATCEQKEIGLNGAFNIGETGIVNQQQVIAQQCETQVEEYENQLTK